MRKKMRPKKVLIFIFSALIVLPAWSQSVRINRLRLGIDPIRSASMLFKEKDAYHNSFFFNTWEVNGEVIGPYRTSILAEFGHTKAHLQKSTGTLDYHSEGYYFKIGLDFNLMEDDSKYEFDIGWRVGGCSFTQQGAINLESHQWDTEISKKFSEPQKQMHWGEILFSQKMRLFYNNPYLNDFWFGISLRLKFMNYGPASNNPTSNLMIPGYGIYSGFAPGITFNLCYQINFKRSVIQELMHKHDNEFITR
jgi:hypothetical protein